MGNHKTGLHDCIPSNHVPGMRHESPSPGIMGSRLALYCARNKIPVIFLPSVVTKVHVPIWIHSSGPPQPRRVSRPPARNPAYSGAPHTSQAAFGISNHGHNPRAPLCAQSAPYVDIGGGASFSQLSATSGAPLRAGLPKCGYSPGCSGLH